MAVPNRPSAGGVVESAWGQVAHDTAVAQDIQTGVVNVSLAASALGTTAVTFPRPFASAPAVVVTSFGSSAYFSLASNVAAGGFTAALSHRDGTSTTVGPYPVHWIAIGPRA